ncbi:carbohydrate ABC transporter permease [Paenarthrobacter sp. AMU7]|uniref:Carbohydrate ABC transporter permease n=1 Tax=Paenarthrobacter sp. AMU7 TaxID=3162492 RepID=A0AB39YPQ0_9MICC
MSIETQTRPAAPTRSPLRNSAQNGSTIARGGGILALVILALMWLLPILWGVTTSLKSEEDAATSPFVAPASGWNFDAYVRVLSQGDVPRWMLNSLGISIAVTVLTVGISALAAYGFSRMEFRGRRWLFAMTVASIMVPGQILIVPLYQQMNSMQLADTWAGIVLPQVVAPMMVFILKNFFDTIPKELEEAARIDGAGGLRVFFTIVMPLSRTILIAVSIFVFIGAWNNFLWPFIVTNNPDLLTLPVGLATIKNAYGVQYAQTMASAILAALPLLIMFMLFQRHIVKGFATSGLGGQ